MTINKRILLTVIVGAAIVLIPTSVMAAKRMPWTDNVYSISTSERNQDGGKGGANVSYFHHNGNDCYVTSEWNDRSHSISCVRAK